MYHFECCKILYAIFRKNGPLTSSTKMALKMSKASLAPTGPNIDCSAPERARSSTSWRKDLKYYTSVSQNCELERGTATLSPAWFEQGKDVCIFIIQNTLTIYITDASPCNESIGRPPNLRKYYMDPKHWMAFSSFICNFVNHPPWSLQIISSGDIITLRR
jgi:hypothetical protein